MRPKYNDYFKLKKKNKETFTYFIKITLFHACENLCVVEVVTYLP